MRDFQNLRAKYFKNPLISYLNINSVRNKIIDLKEIVKYLKLNYFVISETKIDERFSPQQLLWATWRLGLGKIRTVMGVV